MKSILACRRGCLSALAVVAVLGVSAAAMADGAGEIKYRQSVMKSIGGHMGALTAIVKGATANKQDMVMHAKAMLELAKIAPHVFPKDSDSFAGKTRAKPEIWTDPADFAKKLAAFEAEAGMVVKAAETGDTGKLAAAVGSMGKNACKACHSKYEDDK